MSRNSVVMLEVVESTWILKSPSSSTDGEVAESWVRNSEKSERKSGIGLEGGR